MAQHVPNDGVVSRMVVVGVKESWIGFTRRVGIIYKNQYERFPLVGARESRAPNTPPQAEDTPRFFLWISKACFGSGLVNMSAVIWAEGQYFNCIV